MSTVSHKCGSYESEWSKCENDESQWSKCESRVRERRKGSVCSVNRNRVQPRSSIIELQSDCRHVKVVAKGICNDRGDKTSTTVKPLFT